MESSRPAARAENLVGIQVPDGHATDKSPITVPTTPMISPWRMKIRMIVREVPPMAVMIAMSRFFSITINVRVLTIFRDATRTMSPMAMNIASRSSRKAENSGRFSSIHVFVL